MGGLILFLAGGAIALGLLVLALWQGGRLILKNWLNGADGMALFTSPALDAAKALIGDWWKAGLGAVIGAALALPLGQCQGADAERTRQAAKAAEARTAAVTRNAQAKDASAAQHLRDDRATRQTEEDLNRADDANPDSRPSDNRRDRLCGVLRKQAAERGAAVPPECRPGG